MQGGSVGLHELNKTVDKTKGSTLMKKRLGN